MHNKTSVQRCNITPFSADPGYPECRQKRRTQYDVLCHMRSLPHQRGKNMHQIRIRNRREPAQIFPYLQNICTKILLKWEDCSACWLEKLKIITATATGNSQIRYFFLHSFFIHKPLFSHCSPESVRSVYMIRTSFRYTSDRLTEQCVYATSLSSAGIFVNEECSISG